VSHATFVVRISGDEPGQPRGTVICVRTGERFAFRGLRDAADVLTRAIASEMSLSSEVRSDMRPPPYSPIVDRPPLRWPGGARVAVWPMLAIEHFVWGQPGTAIQPLLTEHPEVANWAWRDYGNRVGVWRVFDLFDALDVPLTICLSAEACERYPRIVEAIKAHPAWAVLPHGLNNNTAGHRGLTRTAERARIDQTRVMIQEAFGKPAPGFMVPNWSMTEETFDVLLESGVRYTTDWMNDDQPYWYELPRGRLLNIPYSLETNDYTLVLTARLPGPEVARAVIDHVEQLRADGTVHGRCMAIGIHSFISGQPLRARYVREYLAHMKARDDVWLTTADAISDLFADGGQLCRRLQRGV